MHKNLAKNSIDLSNKSTKDIAEYLLAVQYDLAKKGFRITIDKRQNPVTIAKIHNK